MIDDDFCGGEAMVRLFDTDDGLTAWGFSRTYAGLEAFHGKVNRPFSGKMLKSLDGYSKWTGKWLEGQCPMFIEQDGEFVAMGNAFSTMSYMRFLSMDHGDPPVDIMWNNDLSSRLNRRPGGWRVWRRAHAEDCKMRSLRKCLYGLDWLREDATAKCIEMMDANQILTHAWSEQSGHRRIAARCIGWLCRHDKPLAAIDLLRDIDESVRRVALGSIQMFDVGGHLDCVIMAAMSGDWRTRMAALNCLAELLRCDSMVSNFDRGICSSLGMPPELLGVGTFMDDKVSRALAMLADDREFEVRIRCAALMQDILSGMPGWSFGASDQAVRIARETACANRHDDWFVPELMMKLMGT